MRYPAALPVVAALVLAAPSAQAFTFGDQGATSNYTPNNFSSTLNSYGSTLTAPGQPARSFSDALATTPGTSSAGTGSQMGGFSFHVGPQSNSFGAMKLTPPAWSYNPLYLDRGGAQ
jgi:hypothetical protein